MSVKSFKFVSPGVFINEIDNSFIPKSADTIGPVIIGRASRGLGMQPVTVSSYSDFVNMFGDTVPGKAGGDISRNGNYQSPMYGTFAAKAFLNANVAPVTYVRLLGVADSAASADGAAGWDTDNTIANPGTATVPKDDTHLNGGAYGLFVFPSYTSGSAALGTGYLGAVMYVNASGSLALSGTMATIAPGGVTHASRGTGLVVASGPQNEWTIRVSSSQTTAAYRAKDITFSFDDSKETFIRKRLNTNPQLVTTPGVLIGSASYQPYWLGGTFEQSLRDNSAIGVGAAAVLLPLALSGAATTTGPNIMRQSTREATAGWFIGQDLANDHTLYDPKKTQKLFRLIGRGHGAWINRNLKVSISNVRVSNSTVSDYGTFSVVLRSISDNDNAVQVVERWDECSLDPASPNYVARKIGDKYTKWDTTNRRLKTYGEYNNESKFVYVEMNSDVDDGATDATLLPVGYYGPPKFKNTGAVFSRTTGAPLTNTYINFGPNVVGAYGGLIPYNANAAALAFGAILSGAGGMFTGSLNFPAARLRLSASDGGLAAPQSAYWGYQTTRTTTSTRYDPSTADMHRWWSSAVTADPTSGDSISTVAGIDSWCDIVSLLNVKTSSVAPVGAFFYESGSYEGATPTSYIRPDAGRSLEDLLNLGYNRFTAPFWGGFDGFDIKKSDPMYNNGIGTTEAGSYTYNTAKRAIDTVVDPEFINMNLLVQPGLTNTTLTQHMINVCEERADTMALIDLPNIYIPSHEAYYASKSDRGDASVSPVNAAKALRDRRIDSSYGATFYPWVQTRDENTGRLLWVPPSVAMMGVLASSQAKSDVWFAPAGFNRGGLSDGAAGIPVVNVSERLVSKDRDTLYEARINPIASFPSSGIVVFGQKTLQERQSALDRINVRRLVIYLKKQISILSTQVLFEQNVQATWNRFKSLVEPFLANVRIQFGITDYRLILDESTTTPELIDQNIMYAKIMIKPARAIEYIAIDFVILNTGASFDD
jgi:hypothetical protein